MVRKVPPDSEFSIRDLAEEFGVTPRTLRFYEQKGLIGPKRRGSARVYSAADRARVELILRGKRVGFSLDEIRDMLDLQFIDLGGRERLEPAIARFEARIEALERQRQDIDDAIDELTSGLTWLRTRLEDREPTSEIKRRARAFEALAAARLEAWTGMPAD
jgi:DNA-binding transcriptional MerR regulator